MKIALTGASGFIGSRIAAAMSNRGHHVTALVRPSSHREHILPFVHRFVVGDHADPSIWRDFLDQADAVVHNSVDWTPLRTGDLTAHLRSNIEGSIRLLDASRQAGVGRFLFVSSVAVYHDISPRWAGLIDENHPLRPGGLYGAYKAAVEAHLWSARARWSMHTAAIRPAAVYGVEPVRLERSHGYEQVKRLMRGERATAEQFPGGGKWVHVDDVAEAAVAAIERDDAAGRAFNLADCYAKFTRLGQHAASLLALPDDRVEPDQAPPAKNMFDKTAAQEILGVPLDRGDEGLRRYVADLIEAVKVRSDDR